MQNALRRVFEYSIKPKLSDKGVLEISVEVPTVRRLEVEHDLLNILF